MKNSIGVLFASLAGAGLLAACNNGSINVPPGTGTNCGGPPSVNQLQVLYPKPHSRVSPLLQNIFISTKGTLPPNNQFNFYLVAGNTSFFTSLFQGTSASQIPNPHATPGYSNPTYYVTSLPPSVPLGTGQTVNIYWNDGGTGCSPHFLVSTFRTK
ncbi:MAG: hypothetical protein JO146_07345 [Candidatus Eremiobacteraeota bacterium]|nr:hypothetical protein [Candidatus Eremiobacteraeota bacterium]